MIPQRSNLIGISFFIWLSSTTDSDLRLSINGLASEAFTGVINSTQYEESLGVRKGIIITFKNFY